MDMTLVASAASVALALFSYARGARNRAIFVGLWAPTILAFASYVRQLRMQDQLDSALGPGNLRDRVERIMQGR